MTRTMSLAVFAALLAACTGQSAHVPYSAAVAAPQVAYRIDGNRYFEVVPLEGMACARARLYYTDQARGIHTDVASWDRVSDGAFVIDAANDQYLVAPIIVSSSGCQTGAGSSDLCASRLYYSQDGGANWKNTISLLYGKVHLIGSKTYVGTLSIDIVDISKTSNISRSDWMRHSEDDFPIPHPRQAPIDTQFHCNSHWKE